MTPAERLAHALTLCDQVRDLNRQLIALQRGLLDLQQTTIRELEAARDEAVRRADEMPTNVQPEPAGVQ